MIRNTITQRFPLEGARLNRWRKSQHITQQAFGDFAGVSKVTIVSYEKGRGIKPSMAEIEAIRSKKEHYWGEEEK